MFFLLLFLPALARAIFTLHEGGVADNFPQQRRQRRQQQQRQQPAAAAAAVLDLSWLAASKGAGPQLR
jgi:hypothetical protein